jgi:hypothetical protein
LLLAVALITAVLCVFASAVRLAYALVPTGIDPDTLESTLGRDGSGPARLERIAKAVAREPRAGWERSLLESLRAPPPERTARINEQLGELDHLVQRWVRVPRVCASICTSSGFLLAAMTLRDGLAAPTETIDGGAVDAVVFQAINVAAVGLAGAAFCVAMQMRARKAATSSARAFDRFVERLERAAAEAGEGELRDRGSGQGSRPG